MRNLRNFGITFAVSLVILGIVAIFASKYVAGAVTDIFNGKDKELDEILNVTVETTPEQGETDERFTKELNGESFNWLIVVSDKRTDVYDDYYPTKSQLEKKDKDEPGLLGEDYRLVEADCIALVRADVVAREYVIMTIPSITRVETGTGDYTLGEVYAIYGIDYLCEKVSSMVGLEINYYTLMNSADLPSLASTVGAIECELPVNIGFNGKEYITYVEPEETTAVETKAETKAPEKDKDKETGDGEETDAPETEPPVVSELDAAGSVKLAKKLEAALLYADYSDGIAEETIILKSFVNGLLNNLSSASDKSLQNMLKSLEGKIKTNITAEDITKCGETIRAYSWLAKQSAVYPGRLVKASANKEAFYMPDINEAMEFFYNYR
ncbi:MAG: hypothetical protein IJ499_02705 [Clostridia bacterium]|nr:hypothetical protein [Clostridia bacterium]